MKLYHSTSIKNANKIVKEGKINAYSYFSENLKVSKYYGSMYGRYKTFEVELSEEIISNGTYYQNLKPITTFKQL